MFYSIRKAKQTVRCWVRPTKFMHYKNQKLNLGKRPTWCTIALSSTFIIIILYMFRATLCSSSGGEIVLTQHMV